MARFRYETKADQFAASLRSMSDPIAFGATAAMHDAGDIVKREGRADIASAGFSRKWQNALRVVVYPKRGVSPNAAAFIFHKIGYAGVFEEGATIVGKPKLWLPLANAPKRIRTPALYIRKIGPLVSINRPGKPPLLAGKAAFSTRGKNVGKVTLTALKRGAAGKPSTLVPLFVGIDRVTIRDRFSIKEITERAAARLGELYLKNLNPDM